MIRTANDERRSRRCRGSLVLIAMLALAALGGAGTASALTTPALLDSLQHKAFDFFWNEANPANGLIKDRGASWAPCSIASTGFGYSAYCIGVDHGWVTRQDARDRIVTGLETLWNGPQGTDPSGMIGYQGLYYHFLDLDTATRTWDSELSTIDTALLFAGIIDARQYFDDAGPEETHLRALADSITTRADWEFVRNGGNGILMGWKPETGFASYGNWVGYNEAMIMYIIALGSPTHAVPESAWFYWTTGYNWSTQYGQTYLIFPPLFGHQYSHCWVDFRDIQDDYMRFRDITYFENSRRATLAAREYCIDNPLGWAGYDELVWGLTASDDPDGYVAHGAPPGQSDNGTITPTAAASSIAFAPEIVIPTLHYFYDDLGFFLWGPYGFYDAFNLTRFWWGDDYIGIDQGPIIIMIENYLNGSVWERFMRDPDIRQGLARAHFASATAVGDDPDDSSPIFELTQNSPNPFRGRTTISYRLNKSGHVTLRLFDAKGRNVRTYVDRSMGKGLHELTLDGGGLPTGVYFYSLESGGQTERKRCILVR